MDSITKFLKSKNSSISENSTLKSSFSGTAAGVGAIPLVGAIDITAKLDNVIEDVIDRSKILVTGCSGFIGFHVAKYLLEQGFSVVGIDNMNKYYSKQLKESRTKLLNRHKNFKFYEEDICNYGFLTKLAKKHEFRDIIHLAAQPGVRYSIENPFEYERSNVQGHLNILELCRNIKNFNKLVYASSSSVYGNNKKLPFSTQDRTDEPISLYAATKKSNEMMSYTYAHLYGINAIGLRFFTVYGSYGRPDMAPFKFTKNIFEEKPIDVYNMGNMKRDFTYINDIVYGVMGALKSNFIGHKVYNLGNSKAEDLKEFIRVIEECVGKKAIINYQPMQPGDVEETFADISDAKQDLGFIPAIDIYTGIPLFVDWYKEYYLAK
ncbi:Uncharacterized protein NF27_EY00230 [Candidatus Jidaibacter acanthamoeba]|uniref:NAD(P)-binding domain-containing protein n=1 Tax=Candidatus Jidaibacter acanthamoebae TaxID=86105 RepID=A0A0C1MS91_9RICK|nr:GDP-mannose 4,6-dehydratase [Candidatus Jidaibacter acanthamoeba]KIE04927.1 Uncharacterized protein NF27_EY00230 [Candidatus Jidaibacter acanthamoeba]